MVFRVESVSDDLSNPAQAAAQSHRPVGRASVVRGSMLVAQNDWTGKVVPLLVFRQSGSVHGLPVDPPAALIDRLNATLQVHGA